MRKIFFFLIAVGLLAPIVRAGEITVSAAISLKDALGEISKTYEKETGDHVGFNFGASGQLAAQIANGAPVDVFISAADKQVDDLVKYNSVNPKTRVVIAGNDLVLIVPADAKDPPKSFEDLADDAKAKRIAVGEPKTVPAGMYAMQTLRNLKLEDRVSARLVYGSNVRQVLDYVRRGEVEAGLVYRTDAMEAGDAVKVVATADAKLHDPIRYPAVVTSETKNAAAAKKFVDYLSGEKARDVLKSKGFAIPQPESSGAFPATSPAQQ